MYIRNKLRIIKFTYGKNVKNKYRHNTSKSRAICDKLTTKGKYNKYSRFQNFFPKIQQILNKYLFCWYMNKLFYSLPQISFSILNLL